MQVPKSACVYYIFNIQPSYSLALRHVSINEEALGKPSSHSHFALIVPCNLKLESPRMMWKSMGNRLALMKPKGMEMQECLPTPALKMTQPLWWAVSKWWYCIKTGCLEFSSDLYHRYSHGELLFSEQWGKWEEIIPPQGCPGGSIS